MNKEKGKEKEKKLSKAEEIKAEESGVKLTDEELEQVTGGNFNSNKIDLHMRFCNMAQN